jgi:hypothetical protein
MAMLFCHSANLVNDSCKGGPLGPSGALSYAVGIVPHILQLQAKDRGFHLETSVSLPQVSTLAEAFHNEAGTLPGPLPHHPVRQFQQRARVSLNGAL